MLLSSYVNCSPKFIDWVCENAAIVAQRNPTGNRELQTLIRRNISLLDPFIKDGISKLSSIYLFNKLTFVVEVAKIKGLFLWVASQNVGIEGNEKQLIQRTNSILRNRYQQDFEKAKAAIDATNGGDYQHGINEFYAEVRRVFPEVCLDLIWRWCKVVLSDSTSVTSTTESLFGRARIAFFFSHAQTPTEINEYVGITLNYINVCKELLRNDDATALKRTCDEAQAQGEVDEWWRGTLHDYIRACDTKGDVSKSVFIRVEKPVPKNVSAENQQHVMTGDSETIEFSLNAALQALFTDSDYVCTGELFKPGLSKEEISAIERAIYYSVRTNTLPSFLSAVCNCSPDELFDKKQNIVNDYLQQSIQVYKILYRLIKSHIVILRQYALTMYLLQGQSVDIPKSKLLKESKTEKAENEIAALREKIAALTAENNGLHDKNASLMRKCNYLQSQLQPDDENCQECETVECDEIAPENQVEYEAAQEESPDDTDWIERLNGYLENRRIVLVGGALNLQKNLKRELPELVLIDKEQNTLSNDSLSHSDIVFVRYSSLSHSLYQKVRSICERYSVPIDYVGPQTAVELLAKEMVQKLDKFYAEVNKV